MTTNLSGSLSEFSLAEVLSLLGMGGRTARMQVTSADAVGTVHLVEGRVSSATADTSRAGLLRGVVAALPVPADDLAQALQAEDPVRALVESGVVDRDAAGQVAAEHCTAAVGTMLEWTSGEFAVWVGLQDPSDIGVRLEVEQLVGAARERAQEWADLRAALPESDTVLALVPEVAQAPVVDADDWAVLARVDGRRTLAQVLAAMGASPLAAGNRLVQLMAQGLVAVHDSGVGAELEHSNQLLDAFEAGPGDEVIELVAMPEPELAPDVRDLFVTEPEAVEEWEAAGAESWVVAEPEPALAVAFDAALEPIPFELGSVELAAEPAGFEVEAPSYDREAVALEVEAPAEPVAYDLVSATDEPAPAFSEPDPVAYELEAFGAEPEAFSAEPEVQVGAPMAFDVEPVAEPAVESFAWSPWAQEMGLGEAPPVAEVAPQAVVGQGFADMVEDVARHGHTDAFPVPQAPVVGAGGGDDPAVESGVVDEVAHFVPQPRDPGDGVLDPSTYAQAAGSHAAHPEHQQVPMTAVEAQAVPEQPQAEAPDPLAGGLLAHLMSSVRGL